MKLSDLKFNVPKSCIADYPANPKDSAKLMILNKKTGHIENKEASDLLDIIKRGDCVVVNETKVFPAKFYGIKEKTNADIEVMLLRELNKEDKIWDVLVEPARKVRIGNKIYFNDGQFYCEVIDNTTARGRTVRFSYNDGNIHDIIEKIGDMPIPDYLGRKPEPSDKDTYQTEYANQNFNASIAPPSAGLLVTDELLKKLEDKGVRIAKVVTNIGLCAYEKIEVEDVTKYRMYSEYFEVPLSSAELINKSLKSKKQIYAIGSSVVRALENSVLTTGAIKPNKGWTDKYIYPNYEFKIVSRMLTSFHQPASPSLLLSVAFCDNNKDFLFKAYKQAMKTDYKFFVYGDGLLIV